MKYCAAYVLWKSVILFPCLLSQCVFAFGFSENEFDIIKREVRQQESVLQAADNYTEQCDGGSVIPDSVQETWTQSFSQYNEALAAHGIVIQSTKSAHPEEPATYQRVLPFKTQVKALGEGTDLASYMQLGHQIYRYRSTSPACLRIDPQLDKFFKGASPLVTFFYGSYRFIPSDSQLKELCENDTDPNRIEIVSEDQEDGLPWGERTMHHFGQLGLLKGSLPATLLSQVKLIERNATLLPREATPGANTFSGMNLFQTSLLTVLDNSAARPVSISSLDVPQQHAMLAVFLQGSADYSWHNPKAIQSTFKMTPTSGNVVLKTKRDHDAYYLIDTKAQGKSHNQLIWLGFYGDKLYVGLYPTEGLLLAYEIPESHQKTFIAQLYGLFSLMTTTYTSGLCSNCSEKESVTKAHMTQARPILQGGFIANPVGHISEEETDAAQQSVEFSYKADGSFNVKIVNTPEEEPVLVKPSSGLCGLGRFCSYITAIPGMGLQYCRSLFNPHTQTTEESHKKK